MLESISLRAPGEPSGGSLLGAVGFPPARQVTTTTPEPRTASPRPLASLLAAVRGASLWGDTATPVADVAYRSSEVRPGTLFFCVPGTHVDGHDFAGPASRAGASALVVERRLDVDLPQVVVPSVRAAMGPLSAAFFGHPSRRMTLVGVTGTNGKTTTTYLLESIFAAAGHTAGLIGTTGVRIAGRPVPFDRTTPEAPDLQRLLAVMVEEGVDAAAMEVSSHGLDQRRVDGTSYRCAVFTNLTQDHLDYHGTMEEYFRAKARLFTPELSARGAINADHPEGRRLLTESLIPAVAFGLAHGDKDFRATNVEITASGIEFDVGGLHVRSRLRGSFNVENCLAAVTAARQVDIEPSAIRLGIERLSGVPGRLETVEAGQPFLVVVDYAHTPDSVENVLRTARALTASRLIVVFGCGGDRDRGKRPLMGASATALADLTFITSDNPRSEEPGRIIEEILPGARSGGGAYAVQPDRRRAIGEALAEAGPGDVVVIAGKGHETGQQFADRTVPFDDRLVAGEALGALGYSASGEPRP